MLIVVALIGIVASIALPSYRHATLKAREAVLREDLWVLRDVIDQYHTDRGKYPTSLEDLADSGAGYLRKIPVDPMTGSSDTWQTTTEPLGEDVPEEEDVEPGITDVHSGATGIGLDGTEYSSW
jgi:general secretion pathway protein G